MIGVGTKHLLAMLLVGGAFVTPRPARADDMACVAASETEVGLRKQQKLRAALEQLALCSAPGCPAEVRAECDQRAVALNAALPSVVLVATDAQGNDLSQVTVTLDGAPFATVLDGRALPLDPGNHVLRFAAPGKPAVDKSIVAHESEKGRQVSVVLGTPAVGPALPVPPGAVPPPVVSAPVASDAPPNGAHWSTRRTLAVASAGVGVIGLGVGAVFGIVGLSDASAVKSDCPAAGCANHAQAVSDRNSSLLAGNVSTAAFIVGGLGLAAGAVLWFTAPKSAGASATSTSYFEVVPMVSTRGGGGLQLSGRFQ
jgi:hypothetical protein